MITKKMLENAHKITFIVQNYPQHKLNTVFSLLQLPAIDINSGLWAAQECGYIGAPDPNTGEIKLLTPPDPYEFGEVVGDLQKTIVYNFHQLAKKEADLEETYFSTWVEGMPRRMYSSP